MTDPLPGRTVLPSGLLWRFGAAVLDEAALRLTVNGTEVPLERRPLELLLLLLRHAGEVVTKEEILDALWPDRIVTEASLTKCLSRLRAALGDAEQTVIRTVHGYGYRLAVEVAVSAPARLPPAALELAAGDAVPGRSGWRLRHRLDAGGFGDVWLAVEDGTGAQRVLKFATDAAGVAALRREIALTRLLRAGLGSREDIARVLGWNLTEPPCFLETAWYPDGNLRDFLAARGGAGAVSLPERVELAAEIADALAAAHGMGVLHKDLKPANVLIRRDGAGAPHVLLADFGSGAVLDPARFAAFGITFAPTAAETGSSFTLPYRAPELLAGRAPTVQADVYALGVILYQLVIGDLAAPLAPGWEDAVADPLLRADIAAASAGDPARRLADAAALATRLRSLPARREAAAAAARQQEEAARLRVALDRAAARRGPVLALIAVLALGLAGSSFLAWRAISSGRAARQAAARAEAVTAFLTRDVLSHANPFLAADPNATVKDILAAAAGALDRRFPAASPDRIAIEQIIGNAYAGLGDARGLALLSAARDHSRRVLGDAAAQTQRIRLDIGDYYDRLEDSGRAMATAREVLDAGAGGAMPADVALRARTLLATNRCNLEPAEAACVAPIRALLDEATRRLGPTDEVTLTLQSNLAFNLAQAQRFPEAIALARMAAARTAGAYGGDTLYAQDARYALGQVLTEAGQTGEAIAIFTDIRARLRREAGRENAATMRVANQIGKTYYAAHRYDEALPLFQAVYDDARQRMGPDHVATRSARNNVANTLLQLGRAREALPIQWAVVDTERRLSGSENPQTLWCENALAQIQAKAGDPAAALATYDDLLAHARTAFTHGEWDLAQFELGAGKLLAQQGRPDAARRLLADSVTRFTQALGRDHARTAAARQALASLEGVASAAPH